MIAVITYLFIILGIVSLFRPAWLLYLFFALPVFYKIPGGFTREETEFLIMKIGSVSLYLQDYLLVITACAMLIMLVRNARSSEPSNKVFFQGPLSKVVLVVFCWNFFIALLSIQKGFSIPNALRVLSNAIPMMMVFFIPMIREIDWDKERFFKFSILAGLLLVGFALIRYFVTGEHELTSSETLRTLEGNETVILMFPLCYLMFYSNLGLKNRFWCVTAVLLLVLGIHLTGHRSGYVVFLFTLVAYYFYGIIEKLRYLWIPAFGMAALIFLAALPFVLGITPGQSLARDMVLRFNDTFNLQNKTTLERLSYWPYVKETLYVSPVLGLGRFPAYHPDIQYRSETTGVIVQGEGGIIRAAHNFLVDKFIHEGSAGLAVLSAFIIVLLKESVLIRRRHYRYGNFLTCYISGFFIFCLFNTPFSTNHAFYLYLAAGFVNRETIGFQDEKASNQ